ncbi:MAG: amidase [Janthinobacterium lividum]
MIDTCDMPTTHNSEIYIDHRPTRDAACVAVARASGGLIVGKTDTLEFAAGGRRAATRNPHNLAYGPGGSSSGSAAAVGARMVQLAFGTQTGGSHIRPASFNGAYANKPTHGVVSREGAKMYSSTLDTMGWYGRQVEDLQLVAQAFQLLDIGVKRTVRLQRLKVGVCRTHNWSSADAYGREAFLEAARRLEAAGAIVTEITLPADFRKMNEAHTVIMRAEGRTAFLPDYLESHHLLHQDFRDMVENALKITPAKLAKAHDLAARCRQQFDALFGKDLDVILTPASSGQAPEGNQDTGSAIFNSMWTLLHVSCVAIPVGATPSGLPLGIQLVGPRYLDARLLAVAAACAPAIHPNGMLTPIVADAGPG